VFADIAFEDFFSGSRLPDFVGPMKAKLLTSMPSGDP
jgi:hypothetical protein